MICFASDALMCTEACVRAGVVATTPSIRANTQYIFKLMHHSYEQRARLTRKLGEICIFFFFSFLFVRSFVIMMSFACG